MRGISRLGRVAATAAAASLTLAALAALTTGATSASAGDGPARADHGSLPQAKEIVSAQGMRGAGTVTSYARTWF